MANNGTTSRGFSVSASTFADFRREHKHPAPLAKPKEHCIRGLLSKVGNAIGINLHSKSTNDDADEEEDSSHERKHFEYLAPPHSDRGVAFVEPLHNCGRDLTNQAFPHAESAVVSPSQTCLTPAQDIAASQAKLRDLP